MKIKSESTSIQSRHWDIEYDKQFKVTMKTSKVPQKSSDLSLFFIFPPGTIVFRERNYSEGEWKALMIFVETIPLGITISQSGDGLNVNGSNRNE